MKSKGTIIIGIAIMFFAAIYIGVYVGRITSTNTVYMPDVSENTYTLPDEDESDGIAAVELNKATVDSLSEIPGISFSLAAEIIAYREEYGDYVDIDELLEVDGMTEALFAQIKDYVTVDDSLRWNHP